ncbi:hypothetical protein ACHAWF_007700 [Thalassiosira exigua]
MERLSCASCGASAPTKEKDPNGDQPPLLRCARCKSTYYCSSTCQRRDWPQHKASCRPPPPPPREKDEEERRAEEADELWARGVDLYLHGRSFPVPNPPMVEALRTFEASLEVNPDHAQRQYFVGVCYVAMVGNDEKALSYLEKAYELDPSDRVIALELHYVHAKRDDLDACRRHAEEVVKRTEGLWTNHWQRPGAMVRDVTSKPFWERTEFDWTEELEGQASVVREELLDLMGGDADVMPRRWDDFWTAGGSGGSASGHGADLIDGDGTATRGPEWRTCHLFGGSPDAEEEARSRAPKTMALIERLVPEAAELCRGGPGEVCFGVLGPGTRLKPHGASTNARLACHLALIVPEEEDCRIRVGEEWRRWKEGECLFFDDSFEHEVEHNGTKPRAVLSLRFWHPEIPIDRRDETLEEGLSQFNELQRRRQVPPMGEEQQRAFEEHMRMMQMRARQEQEEREAQEREIARNLLDDSPVELT